MVIDMFINKVICLYLWFVLNEIISVVICWDYKYVISFKVLGCKIIFIKI